MRHLECQGDKRKTGSVDANEQVVQRVDRRDAAVDRRRHPQKLGMHRLLRMSAHKAHALGQRMSRGKRHGKCGKRLGHCLFCIVLLAPALKAIPGGANGKRSNKSQDKSEGR